jgi:hypothetical protein
MEQQQQPQRMTAWVHFRMAGRNELNLMVEFILSITKTVLRNGTILGPKENKKARNLCLQVGK